jgi:GH25 family lysozyme M1 (1,4-beta-N-acetylmuramidase)
MIRAGLAAAMFAVLAPVANAQAPGKLDRPWEAAESVLVIDPYRLNAIDWDKLATDPKVVGVIHQATQGLTKDSKYDERRAEAQKRGYLWGAYHLGLAGDPVAQASAFLEAIGPIDGVLLALDLEDTEKASNMNIADAIRFMDAVRERTGRTPVVYANNKVTQLLSADADFKAKYGTAPLWYARFRTSLQPGYFGQWSDYLLWQFSAEFNCTRDACPYRVSGVAPDMDINVFWGTREQLAEKWATPAPAQ